jgi:hypothetical protein
MDATRDPSQSLTEARVGVLIGRIVLAAWLASLAACGGSEPRESAATSGSGAGAPPAAPAPAPPPPPPTIEGYPGLPPLIGDASNKIEDLSGDLRAMLARSQGAAGDLANDLASTAPNPPPDALLLRFATTLSAAVGGSKLDDAARLRLAQLLFVAMQGASLDDAGLTKLQGDVSGVLTGAGAPKARVDAVTRDLGSVVAAIKKAAA